MHFLGVKEFKTKQIRNSDFIEYEFLDGMNESNTEGKTVKMAQCFGFRNIQNIVRSIKLGKCDYAYIEMMACPAGCFNGGGQVKVPDVKPK
jgi:iron only hydrogenase large subunit-like protein